MVVNTLQLQWLFTGSLTCNMMFFLSGMLPLNVPYQPVHEHYHASIPLFSIMLTTGGHVVIIWFSHWQGVGEGTSARIALMFLQNIGIYL